MRKLLTLLVLQLVTASWLYCQEIKKGAGSTEPNTDNVLPVIGYQQNSPLAIEAVAVGCNDIGQMNTIYRIRNASHRVITDYTLIRWLSSNTGSIAPGAMPSSKILKPGESIDTMSLQNSSCTSNSSVQSERDINQSTRISRILFVMVGEVLFENKEKYSDIATLERLKNHLAMFEQQYQNLK
jgi:hypothetical protein